MTKETLIIHTDTWNILKGLEDVQLGKLFAALMTYQRGEDLPKMDNITRMAFDFMAAQVDRDNEKYERTVEKRRAAANARWGKQNGNMQMHNLQCHTDTDTDTDTVTDTDTERYVSLPSLSLEDREKICRTYQDAEALIEQVKVYYTNHRDRPFPGWADAVKLFNHNQMRWGKNTAQRGTLQSMQEILNRVVPED